MTAPAAMPRFAAVLCPDPNGAAGRAAAEWLGRCAARDAIVAQPSIPGVAGALFTALTEEPRRAGFHAVLKAPFAAGTGVTRRQIADELAAAAARRPAFNLPSLSVSLHAGCLALVPQSRNDSVPLLAAEVVMRLERFRANATGEEIRERVAAGLSVRQHALLLRWGDPHVMDEFRLHFPLTGQLTMFGEELAERLAIHAARHFAPVTDELRRIDRIALLEQPVTGARFRVVETFPLALPRN